MEEMVCNCKMVDEAEILAVLTLQPFPDLAYIQQKTEAGTGCRRCVPALKVLIDRYISVRQNSANEKLS